MQNRKAIVTLAIGQEYVDNWQKYCCPSWEKYAAKYDFDLICLQRPLDTSLRAKQRSPAWQKCLIFGQESVSKYEQVVWLDSDIIINESAPDLTFDVPPDKVGAVAEDAPYADVYIKRACRRWPNVDITRTAREYHSRFGLPADCKRQINTGVLVLSPGFHRPLLEHVYYNYEDRGGTEWHYEQRPLSYELVKNNLVYLMDRRFNVVLPHEEFQHYPFALLSPPPEEIQVFSLQDRIARKLRRMQSKLRVKLTGPALRLLQTEVVNTIFQSSYFCHFGFNAMEKMPMVRQKAKAWWDVYSKP